MKGGGESETPGVRTLPRLQVFSWSKVSLAFSPLAEADIKGGIVNFLEKWWFGLERVLKDFRL